MSITNPTVGQLLDRYSALELKMERFSESGKNTDHLRSEYMCIGQRMNEKGLSFEPFNGPMNSLKAIHSLMWDLVDIVGSEQSNDIVAEAARRLHHLNLRRYDVIADIDRPMGQHTGDEKL